MATTSESGKRAPTETVAGGGEKKRKADGAKSIFKKAALEDETFEDHNLLIPIGDDMALELGCNHWSHTNWLNVGFKGGRSAWQESVRSVTVHLQAFTLQTRTELKQTISFNPTHPKREWDGGEALGRRYPGFACTIGIDYETECVAKWTIEATIELK